MKRAITGTFLTCLAILLAYYGWFFTQNRQETGEETVKVGFLFENDESTPYTYNFIAARDTLQRKFPERVEVLSRSNVPPEETEESLRDLISNGCTVLFCNNYSDQFAAMASQYPDITFCQVSYSENGTEGRPKNYHTFNGAIYQARYVSGVAAGMKLQQMIDEGRITSRQALVGYVAAFQTPEVISGYTAFFLGVRSIVPEARMLVRTIHSWSNFSLEKQTARDLIDEGCLVISQHTDTIGPALACEEAETPVYFVGYNKSMMDVAPDTALMSVRIYWVPYVTDAVEAVLEGKTIEKYVSGNAFGNDMCAGFERSWVQILEPNVAQLAPGTQEKINEVITALQRGSLSVFQGPYVGVNPADPSDIINLSGGFQENKASSFPTFHYILEDVIEVR